jgi:hypothetical protein
MKYIKKIIFAVCFLLLLPTISRAEDKLKIRRLTGKIEFDGKPYEEAWSEAEMIPLVMHRPNFGSDPSEKTEVMIGFDDQYLWIGARLYMKDTSKIFAVTKKRDDMMMGLDAFGVLIDTYNDNENALCFFTAPTGLRSDYTVSNDGAMNSAMPMDVMNYSWNTFWDVKTVTDDKGWYAEMRIPFSSLRFKSENDIATMGLIVVRNISAHNETDTYPAIDPSYGFMATNKPSLAKKITIEGTRPSKPVYVAPYVIGGFSRSFATDEGNTKYIRTDKPELNAGLDLKYSFNSNLNLDLTVNTDFAQVEADDQQVNLTRFSLFFPEKRMFFQERSSLFNFSLGGDFDNLFYSRNIGISGQTPVRIYGGARFVGRAGGMDIGVLDMQTAKYGDSPSDNFGVFRLRKQVINPNSYVGAIMTSRMGANGDQNVAYGIDGIFKLYGDDYLSLKWSQTYDSKTGNTMKGLDPSFFLINWERRNEKGFAYNFRYTYSGEKFNPGIGFIQRTGGVMGINGKILYGWYPGEKSKLLNYLIHLKADRYSRISDSKLESMIINPIFELNTKKDIHLEIGAEIHQEGVTEDFNLSDSVKIMAGMHNFSFMHSMIATSQAKKISVMGEIFAGQFYDGNRYGIRPEININVSSSLKLVTGYEFDLISFPGRLTNKSLNIASINIKAIYMFTTKLTATAFVQYVNTTDEMISNFRLRYNPREGNDFYLVLNDYRALGNRHSIPEPPSYYDRTIMVKYTHTFVF